MTGSEHNFKQSRESWERAVFDNASHFSVVLYHPRKRQEFPLFREAVTAARAWQGAHGRPALVYAITASGRSALVERDQWDALLQES